MPLIYTMICWEELCYARAPWTSAMMAWAMGPLIIEKGNDELKKELLPRIVKGDVIFWLAMSEPDAGSDLLALKTTAVDKGDHFLVNGQKVWSTYAHLADFGELFVRTENDPSVPKHKGISVLLLDKTLPGVSVKPLVNLIGEVYHNEVFLDNVKVPKRYLLGEKNKGFYQMLEGLEFDRFWSRFIKAPFCRGILEDLVRYVKETRRNGRLLAEDPSVRNELADSAIEIEVCDEIFWHAGRMINQGLPLTYEASAGKILADDMGIRLFSKGSDLMGLYPEPGESDEWTALRKQMLLWYYTGVGMTIAGGTSEINRNTIATIGLGLPRG